MIAACAGQVSDLGVYRENRELLYGSLTEYGYECVYPDGAFYLDVKALEEDANAFCERAKKYELLLVPGDDFRSPRVCADRLLRHHRSDPPLSGPFGLWQRSTAFKN